MQDATAILRPNLALIEEPARKYRPSQYLAREGEEQFRIHRILDGWALRYKLLPDGRRQIAALFLPGDCCDILWISNGRAASHVLALTPVTTAPIPIGSLRARARIDAALEEWLWTEATAMSEIQTEWIINLGRKRAVEKLAHVLCEIFLRLRAVGKTEGDRCWMPLTQAELGDLTGLTPVHVNRTLQDMRAAGLLDLRGKWLWIPDLDQLRRLSLFYDEYARILSRPKLGNAERQPAQPPLAERPGRPTDRQAAAL